MWLILFSLALSPLSNLTNSIDLFLLFPMLSIDKCKQFAIEASLPSRAKFEPHRQNQRIYSWGQPSLKSKFLTQGKYSNLLSIKNLSTCYYFLYIALSLSLSLSPLQSVSLHLAVHTIIGIFYLSVCNILQGLAEHFHSDACSVAYVCFPLAHVFCVNL